MRFGAAILRVLTLELSKSHRILFTMCSIDFEKIFEKTSFIFENETHSDDNFFRLQELPGARSLDTPRPFYGHLISFS